MKCWRRGRWGRRLCALALLVSALWLAVATSAHNFVPQQMRVGAYPQREGTGWLGKVFLDVPSFDLRHLAQIQECMRGPLQSLERGCRSADLDSDGDADLGDVARIQRSFHTANLIWAERLISDRDPDFTFRTPWIDFPAGPQGYGFDDEFATMGDFLDDYIYDVSRPELLDAPFGSFIIRFTGFLAVRLEDEVREGVSGLPIWIDTGTLGYDAYSTIIGVTVYREINVGRPQGQTFINWGPSVEVLGLFPIAVVYYNIFDPQGRTNNDRAGIEQYSWHGGGLPWPAGQLMVHSQRGPGTLIPPRVIYQQEDIQLVVKGDFEADFDIDLKDFQWYQFCANPEYFFLPTWCEPFDVDNNRRIELAEYAQFLEAMNGPGAPGGLEGP